MYTFVQVLIKYCDANLFCIWVVIEGMICTFSMDVWFQNLYFKHEWSFCFLTGVDQYVQRVPLLLPESEMIQKSVAVVQHSSVYYARPLAVLSAPFYKPPGALWGPLRLYRHLFMHVKSMCLVCMPAWCCKWVFYHFLKVWFNLWLSIPQWLNTKITKLERFVIMEFVFQTKQKQSKKSREGGQD